MLIKNVETKIKLSLLTVVLTMVFGTVVVVAILFFAYRLVSDSRNSIYVLDNGVPVLVQQTKNDVNRLVEYKSHINLYHLLFFTLPPDDEFIKNNITKAMYLVDHSGMVEYNNLKEKGYYNAILSSSSTVSIRTDSIKLNTEEKTFIYYGTQRIERKTKVTTRNLVTTGNIKDILRSENNPHGALITNWKTIQNNDISNVKKRSI